MQAGADDVTLEFVPSEGAPVQVGLAGAEASDIVEGLPVRRFGSYAGMRHYPGWWWSSTIGDLVGYESLLERDRVLLADFDPSVTGIASQPFGISGLLDGKKRHHVPDYLLMASSRPLVVDVKPAQLLKRSEVTELLEWTAGLMAARGWRYEVWSGESPQLLENLHFLAQGRRPRVDEQAAQLLRGCGSVGTSLSEAMARAVGRGGPAPSLLRSALVRLLWLQEWEVDLSVPLTGNATILSIKEAP